MPKPRYCVRHLQNPDITVPESKRGNYSQSVEGCVVYFVAAPELDRVKIGRAKDFRKRLSALAGGSPARLAPLGTIPGGPAVENYLHAAFIEDRVHGEWFNLTPAIRRVAESGELPEASAGISLRGTTAAAELFRRFALIEQGLAEGITAPHALAARAGCTEGQIAEAIPTMRWFGFLRGTRAPDTEIQLMAA